MSLYVEGYGYFVITECTETRDYDQSVVSKSIRAQSAEIELMNCEAPALDQGTYRFLNTTGKNGVLDICATLSPRWKIKQKNIEESLETVERFFAKDATQYDNLYDFLIQCLQERYDCLFEFDCIQREIHAVSKAYYVETHLTDIHLSKDNILTKLEKVSSSDDIYTAVKATGGNDLSIKEVNPNGTDLVYNFEYRYPVMSDELVAALKKWKQKNNQLMMNTNNSLAMRMLLN